MKKRKRWMANPELASLHIRVYGRVQGVGYRSYVVDQFKLLDLKGWVRNVGYDQVEAVAEGVREVLEEFARLVVQGPRAARVEGSKIEWGDAQGEFSGVEVKYF
jgi:acylphosphatase